MKDITYKIPDKDGKNTEVAGIVLEKVLVQEERTITRPNAEGGFTYISTQYVSIHKFLVHRDTGQIDLVAPDMILSVDGMSTPDKPPY